MILEQTAQIFTVVAGIAQAILVGGLYVAWRQLQVTLQDIRLRSKREAGSIALSQANVFACELIPGFNKIRLGFEEIFGEKGRPLVHFVRSELSKDDISKLNKWSKAKEENNRDGEVMDFTNKLESFSLSFNKGLADETIVFGSLGKTFCEIVEELYFYYSWDREDENSDSYCNTIDLYKKWKSRLRKIKLENQVERIREEIDSVNIHSAPISPIGTNI